MGKTNCITRLEHVRVYLTLSHPRRGALSITLISPSGTRSELLKQRDEDYSSDGFQNWPFMTVFSWDENPHGIWTIQVSDHGNYQGHFRRWSLRLYGTCVETNYNITATEKQSCKEHCKVNCPNKPFAYVCKNCSQYCHCDTGECVALCDEDDVVDEKAKQCLSAKSLTMDDEATCTKNCPRKCPFNKYCNCLTGRCMAICGKDNKVNEKRKHCFPSAGTYPGDNEEEEYSSGELSTFVKWLIIFSLLAILLATVLIMYLFKASGKFCWARPDINKKSVQRNVSYAPVSLNNPEGQNIAMSEQEQRSLVL